MIFTDEQFKALEPFEPYFTTAVRSSWARHPGQPALVTIHSILKKVMDTTLPLNGGCQSCVLNLLKTCGKLFFKDKEERIAMQNEKKAVELSMEEAKPIRKRVTTKRKK